MRNIKTLPDIIKFCATIGNLPTSYMQSLTYEEQLLWLLNFLNETILPTMHETINSIEELENWFNNLDVQEEINNKLEAMAKSGELEEIISEYLNSKAIFGFDTVADMKSATNLINGSYAKTLGHYEVNDGGGALYKIRTVTNDDVVDDKFIIEMNDDLLVGELIIDSGILNIKSIGAKSGDSSSDLSLIIKSAIDKAITNKKFSTIKIPSGYYYCLTPIDYSNTTLYGINIEGDSQNYTGTSTGTVIEYRGTAGSYLFNINTFNRSSVKNINIVGDNTNNIFSINRAYFTTFENVQMSNYQNAVWIKLQSGYLYFNRCGFGNVAENCIGVIINQHYTDGRSYTSSTNTEYIYFNECSMDSNYITNTKAIVVYGGEFIYINNCDICNSKAEGAITFDSTGWGGLLLDIFINNTSFCRNSHSIKMISGTGATGRIKIDGHFTRPGNPTSNDKILTIDGTNTSFSYVTLSGITDDYSGVNSIVLNRTYNFVNNLLVGETGNIVRTNDNNSLNVFTYPAGKKPMLEYITPEVTVEGSTVTYDFSNVIDSSFCGQVLCTGLIGGASSSCYISACLLLASSYSSKIAYSTGTNLTSVTSQSRKVIVQCAYTPNTNIDNMKFIKMR